MRGYGASLVFKSCTNFSSANADLGFCKASNFEYQKKDLWQGFPD